MITSELTPPRWADAILRSCLRPSDRESISGDLLEEYRAVRAPALGSLGANVWYIGQVLSMLWRLIRPAALMLAVQGVFLAMTVFRPGHHAPHHDPAPMWVALPFGVLWYGSIVGAPGVSLLDAAIYSFVAYRGVQRTGLIRTGGLVAAASSFVGSVILFTAAAIVTPGLALALFENPALLLILSVYLLVPLAYSTLIGLSSGSIVRYLVPSTRHPVALPPS
jgi:hypothetical protein